MCLSCSFMSDFAVPWTVVPQVPLSMEFFPARILEWITIPFSRRSSQTRGWTQVCCIEGRFCPSHLKLGSPILYTNQLLAHWSQTVILIDPYILNRSTVQKNIINTVAFDHRLTETTDPKKVYNVVIIDSFFIVKTLPSGVWSK